MTIEKFLSDKNDKSSWYYYGFSNVRRRKIKASQDG